MRAVLLWSAALLFLTILAVSLIRASGGQARAAAPVGVDRQVPLPVGTAPTEIPTDTPVTGTETPGPPTTITPVPTNTRGVPSPVPTDYVSPTPCTINFTDVQPTDWF